MGSHLSHEIETKRYHLKGVEWVGHLSHEIETKVGLSIKWRFVAYYYPTPPAIIVSLFFLISINIIKINFISFISISLFSMTTRIIPVKRWFAACTFAIVLSVCVECFLLLLLSTVISVFLLLLSTAGLCAVARQRKRRLRDGESG